MSNLKTFTIENIRSWKPCYDPSRHLAEGWSGTAVDILKRDDIPLQDRFWVVLRKEVIDEKTLRTFAIWCARQVQHLMADARSHKALDVAERFANGDATRNELAAARAAARDAAWDAAWDAARAAAEGAARAAAWDAARDAAEGAARAAAWDAAEAAAWDAAKGAARAAAWDAARAAAGAAARAAAWDAARDAARDAALDAARAAARDTQLKHLIKLLTEKHKQN